MKREKPFRLSRFQTRPARLQSYLALQYPWPRGLTTQSGFLYVALACIFIYNNFLLVIVASLARTRVQVAFYSGNCSVNTVIDILAQTKFTFTNLFLLFEGTQVWDARISIS